jgi:hypothetical protein
MSAVVLAVIAIALTGMLAASAAARYGSLSAGHTADLLILEIVAMIGAVFVIQRMRDGADWARLLLAVLGLPYMLFLVLRAINTALAPASVIGGLSFAVSAVRLVEAVAVAAAVALMFTPASRSEPPEGRERSRPRAR